MKKILFIILLMFCNISAVDAQEKVLEKSGRKPDWIKTTPGGTLLGIGSGLQMEQARDNAMANIRGQIVEAVSVRVDKKSTSMVRELIIGEESEISSEFIGETTSVSMFNDYIKGISVNKALDHYWEKILNNKTKDISWRYYINYSFTLMELDELIDRFEKQDQELTDIMEEAIQQTENYKSVEDILSCKSRLKYFSSIFDDYRKVKVDISIEKCTKLLNSIYIQNLESEKGVIKYSLFIGEREIFCGLSPRITTNCAEILSEKYGFPINIIEYNSDNCYDEPRNFINVIYMIDGRKVEKNFGLRSEDTNFELYSSGDDIIADVDKNKLLISLIAVNDHPMIILSIDFQLRGVQKNIRLNMNDQIDSRGFHRVIIPVPENLVAENLRGDHIDGYIHYQSQFSKEKKTLRIYNHRIK